MSPETTPNVPSSRFGHQALLRKREVAIRELSFGLWKQVIAVTEKMDPSLPLDEEAVASIGLRGDIAMAQRMVQLARAYEASMAELEMSDNLSFQVFDRLMERAQAGDLSAKHKGEDLPKIITDRVLHEGGSFRESDIDLTDDEVGEIRRMLIESQRDDVIVLFDVMLAQREKMKTALERDSKFPEIHNSAAFATKVRECKAEEGVFVFADIADFKQMNDERYGYDFVDNVILKTVCQSLAEEFDDGLVSRFGGDEFMVYVPEATDQASVARRIARAVYAGLSSVGPETVEEHFASIPDQCATEHWGSPSRSAYHAILMHMKKLHMKIGCTSFQRGNRYEETKVHAESRMKAAALKKKDMRFPTIVEGNPEAFSSAQ